MVVPDFHATTPSDHEGNIASFAAIPTTSTPVRPRSENIFMRLLENILKWLTNVIHPLTKILEELQILCLSRNLSYDMNAK